MEKEILLTGFFYGSIGLHFLFLIWATIRKSKIGFHGSFGYFLLLLSSIFALGFIIPTKIHSNSGFLTVLMVVFMISSVFYYHRHTEELKEEALGKGEKNENKV